MVIYPVYSDVGVSFSTLTGSHCVLTRQSDGRLWCAYLRNDGVATQVAVAYSDDDGATWVENFITAMVVAQGAPAIAIDSLDNIHLAWYGLGYGSNPTKNNIVYRRRTSAGVWEALEQITDMSAGEESFGAQLACDSENNAHLTFYATGDYPPDITAYTIIYCKRSAGVWGSHEVVSQANFKRDPMIALDSNDNIHLVWRDGNLEYCKRTAIGWGTVEVVAVAVNTLPDIVVDLSGNVHVAYQRRPVATDEIYYCRRTAVGWDAEETLTAIGGLNHQRNPSISIDKAGSIFVVWYGKGYGGNPTKYQIVYREKIGASWQVVTLITDRAFNQQWPSVICSLLPLVGGIRTNLPVLRLAGLFTGRDAGGFNVELYTFPVVWLAIPTVTTNPATAISQVSAILNGTLDNDGGEPCECGFEWGLTDAYGLTTPTESRVIGESFSQVIHGLIPSTTYHFRAFATNSAGTGYGADRSFTATPTFNRAHALSREEL